MRYVSVRRLVATLELENAHINEALLNAINQKLTHYFKTNEFLTVFDQKYRSYELKTFFDFLTLDKGHLKHYNLVEDKNYLVEYLLNEGVTDQSIDFPVDKWIEEEGNEGFFTFVSTFLNPILIEKIELGLNENRLEELSYHLKLCKLLPKIKRIHIQKPVVKFLLQRFNQLKVSQETGLAFQLPLVYDLGIVGALNQLDDSYDYLREDYIRTANSLIYKQVINASQLEEIKTAILKVNLNEGSSILRSTVVNTIKSNRQLLIKPSPFENVLKSPWFLAASLMVILYFIFFSEDKDAEVGPDEELSLESSAQAIPEESFPFLLDSLKHHDSIRVLHEKTRANYPVLYIGKERDSLWLEYEIYKYLNYGVELVKAIPENETVVVEQVEIIDSGIWKRHGSYFKDYHLGLKNPYWNDSEIDIQVDTTQIVRNKGRKRYSNIEFSYKAYPVRLKNISDSTINIGYGTQIPIILEKKDSVNLWTACEYQFLYACGNGLNTIFLPESEIVITSVAILEEKIKQEYRLKLGKNYSTTFSF